MNTKITTRQKNKLGENSYSFIIKVAQKQLTENGFHDFTSRKVAIACGISVGNLTYHFPNKTHLIEAVMLSVCEKYQQIRHSDKKPNLKSMIRWMLKDAVDNNTSSLFLELWVMAKHHDFGVKIIENFYSKAIKWITVVLKEEYPNATSNELEKASYFLLTLSEGTVAVFSRPYKRTVHHADIIVFAEIGIENILGNASKR